MAANFDVPFVDKNSERYNFSKRAQKIVTHIEENYFYPHTVPTGDFLYREGQSGIAHLNEGEWTPFSAEKDYWGYYECYAWFKQTVTVPESFKGLPVIYDVQSFENKDQSIQLIVFVNGEMVQGLDPFHRFVQLLDCAQGGEVLEIAMNAYSEAGSQRMNARLRTLNRTARQLYYDILTPLETANLYEVDDGVRVHLVKAVNEAVNMLEMSDEEDLEAFETSAKRAIAYLQKEIYDKPASEIVASCIGHTHIDVAWLWRLRQTRDKAGRSFATVLKYMDEYPEYRFMSPQAQLYDYVRQDYPELFERIKAKVADGQWEVEGSMWVESDTNVTSGESLVRQFLVGKRFFREHFGEETKIMWLPDVFGYSAALPQIIKKSGLDYFMTTKISWNEYDRLPYDSFMWQGIDGTRVLSHFSTGSDAIQARIPSFFTTYNAHLDPNHVLGGWKRYSNKDLNSEYLITFGYGDGGGGPSVPHLEKGRRMAAGIEGCPKVVQQPTREFFHRLEEQVSGDRHLPVWAGELYLQFHRGTLTAQSRNKRYNRKSELLYHDVETLAATAFQLTGAAYPTDELLANWKLILLNQFHDIIPGSSIFPVYEDSREQYLQLLAAGDGMANAAQTAIASAIPAEEDSIVVFNTLGFERSDVVIADVPTDFAAAADAPSQRTYDGKLCFAADAVPGKGWKTFQLTGTPARGAAVDASGKTIETEVFSLTFDENYNITSLIHKPTGRSVAPDGQLLNRLIAFEDRPFNHEAWDIKPYFSEKFWYIDDVQSAEVIESGPVRTVLRVVRKYIRSTIQQDFIFYPAGDRIDVQYVVDWHEKNIALKCDYPVDVNTTRATFDIQFGSLERTTHENSTWDFAQFEVCGHKWADLSDNGFGLSVLNDCKYGWTVKNGHIMPTLLRSATRPNPAQDREVHYFTYSIYPHAGTVTESNVVREGYQLNVPLRAACVQKQQGTLPKSYALVQVDSPNVVIETIKKAEDSDDLIVRTYESANRAVNAVLTFGSAVAQITECDLMEENDVPATAQGASVAVAYKPFEIKTFKVKLA
ncbi:MAG: glycosyl hydrolase-related protein [Oscillospiraceae bacterium]|jgi:alpha-mannosidase|nr:glycosyl hydrolase-related protein [Oscillospiraceae bacterium]